MEIVQLSFLDGKVCTKCKEWKPLYEFGSNGYGKLHSRCKPCKALDGRKWRDEHPEHPEHRERKNKLVRERIAGNREAFNARRREYFKEYYHRDIQRHRAKNAQNQREWRRQNPEKVRANRQAQHARWRVPKGTPSFTAGEFLQLCAKYDNRCLRCGEKLPLSPDHIMPVSKGGSNTIDNIQPLCHLCNSLKGADTTDYRY